MNTPASLGTTETEIWRGWREAKEDLTRHGWRFPYAYDVRQGKEFLFNAAGTLCVSIARRHETPLYRVATEQEICGLEDAVRRGALEVYLRGACGPYADRRADRLVLHLATGQPLISGC